MILRTVTLWALAVLLIAGLGSAAGDLNLPAPVIAPIGDPAEPPVTPPGRVLLIVIDGLRADVAATLPGIGALRATGAQARLWAEGPTFSTAQYVALLAGVPPRDSGVRTNDTIRAAGLDDAAARVVATGRRTLVISDEVDWWNRLFPRSFSLSRVVEPEKLVAEALPRLAEAGFVLVHLVQPDHAGHAVGSSSTAYREAAEEADARVRELAAAWQSTVVVVADHGHRESGGHGGDEADVSESWLVAAGAGIRPGMKLDRARSVDLAPTLAALLGTPAPAQAQGRTLVELLELTDAQRNGLVAADAARQRRVDAATREGRAPLERAQLIGRVVRACLALLFLVAVGPVARSDPRAIGAGAVSLLAATAAFLLIFGLISFSAARTSGRWVGGAAAISAVTGLAALVWGGRGARSLRAFAARAAAITLGTSPLALLAFVVEGIMERRLTCEPGWLAAGPIYAWLTLAPVTLGAALVSTVAMIRKPST